MSKININKKKYFNIFLNKKNILKNNTSIPLNTPWINVEILCFYVLKIFFKKFKYFLFFLFQINIFFVFFDPFDILI
jgi:hypothetical protein